MNEDALLSSCVWRVAEDLREQLNAALKHKMLAVPAVVGKVQPSAGQVPIDGESGGLR